MKASPLGILPHYQHEGGTAEAATIRAVLQQIAPDDRAWDEAGVRMYLNRRPDGYHTCLAKVRMLPAATINRSATLDPRLALNHAMDELARETRRAAIALSGGLDSALVLAMLRARGRDDIPVFTLASQLPGYCELETTRGTTRVLGVKALHVIETNAGEMIAALPSVIAAAECPLFNLHPVSRWILASKLRQEGYEVLITGDGADQVFAGTDPRNYLPIIGALTRAAGVELRSPFVHETVIASAPEPTADKAALRAIARDALPTTWAQGPKTATYAPPLDVSAHWRADAITPLTQRLGCDAPSAGSSPESVLWTTLGLLAALLN